MTGIRIQPNSGQTVYLKDIKFSNSITVEHNTLGGGAIGHIVRNRRVAPDTAVFEDKWLHYDQVGSVLSESDGTGNLSATHYQDAFGVRQADWETGIPGGTREGWAHNTKELDPGTGLMYMYQRHYIPEYGMFMSRAPYEPMMEEEYVFAHQNPVGLVDPNGRSGRQPIHGTDYSFDPGIKNVDFPDPQNVDDWLEEPTINLKGEKIEAGTKLKCKKLPKKVVDLILRKGLRYTLYAVPLFAVGEIGLIVMSPVPAYAPPPTCEQMCGPAYGQSPISSVGELRKYEGCLANCRENGWDR